MSTSTKTKPHSIAPEGFSWWLPPMLVKELRQGLSMPGFVGAFLAFQMFMVLLLSAPIITAPSARPTDRAAAAASIDTFFWTLLGMLLLVVTPGRALVGLRAEIDARTLDLLVLTRLSAWQIVFGKWASLVAQAALMLIAVLPYGIIRYFGGSVSLRSDALDCLLMLGGSAVLTAVALWASLLPRLAVAAVVLVIAANQFTGGVSFLGFSLPLIPTSSLHSVVAKNLPLVLIGGLAVLAFGLVAAVRRIAPPTENYSPLTRGLALLSFVPVPLFVWNQAPEAARLQLTFAGGFLLVICLVELGSNRFPLPAHWEGFRRFGAIGRVFSVLGLPGWPSALLFAALVGSPIFLWLASFSQTGTPAVATSQLAWLTFLALGALVFPAAVLSLFRRAETNFGRLYLLLLTMLSLAAALSLALEATVPFFKLHQLGRIAGVLPVAGFWTTLAREDPNQAVRIVQGSVVAVTLLVAAWQSRGYWRELVAVARRSRGEYS
jgi:hypothetical protein